MTHPTITISAKSLARLLAPVAPFADAEDSLPVLNAVHVRGHGDCLTATATDRYRIAVQRVKVSAPDGLSVVVPLDVVKTLLRTYKPARGLDPELTLTFERHSFTVESGSLGLVVESSRIGYRLIDATYPKVGAVIAEAFKGEPIPTGTFINPRLLAALAAGTAPGEPIGIFGAAPRSDGKIGPIGFAAGDDFRAAIMPVRVADGSSEITEPMSEEWRALVAQPETAEAVAS